MGGGSVWGVTFASRDAQWMKSSIYPGRARDVVVWLWVRSAGQESITGEFLSPKVSRVTREYEEEVVGEEQASKGEDVAARPASQLRRQTVCSSDG